MLSGPFRPGKLEKNLPETGDAVLRTSKPVMKPEISMSSFCENECGMDTGSDGMNSGLL